jgi:nitrite reductase (cytochrome c-552)
MSDTPHPTPRAWLGWAVFGGTAAGVLGVGLLLASILERRAESRPQPPREPIAALEADSARWAINWPREYSSYRKMEDDTTRTKYGGSVPRDYLAETPENVILFAGYGFSKEYRQARGHVYAVEDVTHTGRLSDKTPNTCWTCKSPDVPRVMAELGKGKVASPETASLQELVLAGAGEFYSGKFTERKDQIRHPIGCLDCHEPDTMRLRVSRPALIEAFQRQGRDISAVSHQEMRTLVCAQCHVEYHFEPQTNHLTFPWDKGMGPEAMEAYYTEKGFTDWTHLISKAPMVKMQHPDYEVYSTGIHAYRNVSCADCHMPYQTEGGAKFTSHHLQSPLLNVANSCQVCHRWSEQEIIGRVNSIQDKVAEGRGRAERAIAHAHFDIAACMEAGASDEDLKAVRDLVRQAQLRWDYVAANNGMGFHSPHECMRVLGAAVDLAQECRVECTRILARRGYTDEVQYPDFSTKEKAQALNRLWAEGSAPKLLKKDASVASSN